MAYWDCNVLHWCVLVCMAFWDCKVFVDDWIIVAISGPESNKHHCLFTASLELNQAGSTHHTNTISGS